jgi:hypothetical protein
MVVTSLIGSCLLISLGILGQYIARIYEQAKARPLYLVSRINGDPRKVLEGTRESLLALQEVHASR